LQTDSSSEISSCSSHHKYPVDLELKSASSNAFKMIDEEHLSQEEDELSPRFAIASKFKNLGAIQEILLD